MTKKSAHTFLEELRNGELGVWSPEYMAEAVRKAYAETGTNPKDVPAPEWAKGAKNLDEAITMAEKRGWLKNARQHFGRLLKGDLGAHRTPDGVVKTIRECLAQAGGDAAQLDYNGKKDTAIMEGELAAAVEKIKNPPRHGFRSEEGLHKR